jgi:hypothetical protein
MKQLSLYQTPVWAKAQQQAEKIPQLKNKRTKRHQIVLLCETLKKALRCAA